MAVLWGVIIFFICHTLANIFETNVYCYVNEEKDDSPNSYAMKRYLIKMGVCLAIYIAVLVIAMLVKPFADNKAAILIGNGIGFITGSIHFKLMAEENYRKLKSKHEWDSWNYMSFEEKRETIKRQESKINEDFLPIDSSEEHISDSFQPTHDGKEQTHSNDGKSYAEQIVKFFENENRTETSRETLPNGDEIITINYQIKYIWDLYIKIDKAKSLIKIYTVFFHVAPSKKEKIYEMLSELNRRFLFIKFYFENTPSESFVIAVNDIPLIDNDTLGKYVFDMADEFIKTIDSQFGFVPKDVIGY